MKDQAAGQLFRRIGGLVLGLLALVIASSTALTVRSHYDLLRAKVRDNSRLMAETVALATVDSLVNRDMDELYRLASTLSRDRANVAAIFIADRHGRVLAHSDVDLEGRLIPDLVPPPALTRIQDVALANGAPAWEISTPIVVGHEALGSLRVLIPLAPLLAESRQILAWDLLVGLLFLGMGVLGAAWLARSVTRPVERLAAVADAVAGGDMAVRSGFRSPDEVGMLAAAFDRMLDELSRATVDIAELKRVDAELEKARDAAETASRVKGEFLASMSHELRTPLTAILGMSEALQEEVYGPLNEQQMKSLSRIEESGRHLLALINDILDLSRIEAGKLTLEIAKVSVEALCQASMRFVQLAVQKKRIELSFRPDAAVPYLLADERHLKQVLVNLLNNAVKFTPEGGSIGLEVKGDAEREAVHLTVWDTGIGIGPEDMSHLFQPFVQLDSGLERQYPGTGLGLSLVSRLVALHGGGIALASEPGRGSRFTVTLPWKDPEAEPAGSQAPADAAQVAQQPVSWPGALILLAEDEEVTSHVISDYLQARGYRLALARDGIEAVGLARHERPAVILMDIQMPGVDGREAIRLLRADPATADIPVVALTALAMPGDRERCLEAGANAYLPKPVRLKELIATVEAQIKQRLEGAAP